MGKAATHTHYRVEGMDCGGCAKKIDTAVRRMPGVDDVTVSHAAGTMVVTHLAADDLRHVEKKVRALGYKIEPTGPSTANPRGLSSSQPGQRHDVGEGAWWKVNKATLPIASGLALVAAFAAGKLVPGIVTYAFTGALLIGLIPISRRALVAAFSGTPFSIEMLMTIAAVGAAFIGAAQEAATVVFLFLVGALLEGLAAGKARASIRSLNKLVPKTAFVERDTKTVEMPAAEVPIGAVILIRPGDRIPADGVIISGESAIDEASVTGESSPAQKTIDAQVYAGTVNGEAALRVRVTAAAADNTIARIVKLVEEAQESKAPTERFIDHFSRYYTPAIVFIAALVAIVPPLLLGGLWNVWIYKGLAILLIGCPCALVISTPAAIAASLSAGARRGLLLKGGVVLENLGRINIVAFDKTGTLTEGRPKVTDIIAVGRSQDELVRVAAALETGSSHPLAKAILSEAAIRGLAVPRSADGASIGGKGISGVVEGRDIFLGSTQAAGEYASLSPDLVRRIHALTDQGKTVSVLVADGVVEGVVAVRDEPREDAKAGLKRLTDAGVRIIMLTGDNARTSAAIGRDLGIEVRAELLPQDKQRIVSELQADGLKVAKVGDGINDAPALAAADVGIAMGGGADVALETADAAVLHGHVADVAAMVALSKRTMRNISQNITIALGLKAIFLVTTVAGITGLWPAILADTGATVLVTMNALRLLRSRSVC
jgi:Cd2+/Zn2+-exporting ATPase